MRKFLLIPILFVFIMNINAKDFKEIKLNTPSKNRGLNTMEAFANRQSIREYAPAELSLQDLSDLLWATNGVNRSDGSERRTAPTASNTQEITIYACFKDAAYFYNHKTHSLEPVYEGNLFPAMAVSQDFVNNAPLVLLIVGDPTLFKNGDNVRRAALVNMDGGIVSQNISLFCAANEMATVARATMINEELIKALKLKPTQILVLNHPVGYIKK